MEKALPLIQGKEPDSKEEVRVATSLDKYGWEYTYQYPVYGGKSMRGGQVIDFLVSTVPTPTAVYVQGPYYHGSKHEQKDKLLQDIAFGALNYLVEVIETDKLETQEECDSTILNLFGRSN